MTIECRLALALEGEGAARDLGFNAFLVIFRDKWRDFFSANWRLGSVADAARSFSTSQIGKRCQHKGQCGMSIEWRVSRIDRSDI